MYRSVVVVSADLSFVEALRAQMAELAEVRCVKPDGDLAALHQELPWALVVDIRSGALASEVKSVLMRQASRTSRTRLVLVAPDRTTIERVLDGHVRSIAVCRFYDWARPDDVAKLLRTLGLVDPEDSRQPLSPCYVLQGKTRMFVTYTPELFAVLDELDLVAAHDVTILMVGETGSGKTYLCQLLHELSPRRYERFLPLSCGTLPPHLIESELFGHVKGAFTGAHANKSGKFEAAGRGTLLLDEIDCLGLDQQAKLLRVIETGEFEPVGSNQTKRSVARLMVASNAELEPLVQSGRFRQDLYYRLNVLKFHLPPLRQRPLDILPLTKLFVAQFAQQHGVNIKEVTPEFIAAIRAYSWPGNLRELENAVRRATILCLSGTLTPDLLPPSVYQAYLEQQRGQLQPTAPSSEQEQYLGQVASRRGTTLGQLRALTEREVIEATLRRNAYRRSATARELGVSRVTLYNKIKKYGLQLPKRPKIR